MKLGRKYDEEDYEEASTVVGLRHQEKDERKRTHHNKEEALKGILALL
jgi:hypothetical protein